MADPTRVTKNRPITYYHIVILTTLLFSDAILTKGYMKYFDKFFFILKKSFLPIFKASFFWEITFKKVNYCLTP